MKNAFKKNPALFIGLVLPLLMILLFAGIPFISSFTVPAPEYNFIYTLNNYGPDGKLRVENGKLIFRVHNTLTQAREAPEVFLADVHSKNVTRLNFVLSKGEDSLIPPNKSRDFGIEDITLKKLDTSTIAPDGYQLTTTSNDNVFSLLFFFGNDRRNVLSLSKSSRRVEIPTPNQGYYSTRFEGWIIPN